MHGADLWCRVKAEVGQPGILHQLNTLLRRWKGRHSLGVLGGGCLTQTLSSLHPEKPCTDGARLSAGTRALFLSHTQYVVQQKKSFPKHLRATDHHVINLLAWIS